MFAPLLLGCVTVFITMGIQIAAIVYMLQYLFSIVSDGDNNHYSKGRTTYVISMVMTMLFLGHVAQVAIWAMLFMVLGNSTISSRPFIIPWSILPLLVMVILL